jgi:acylphosphatase
MEKNIVELYAIASGRVQGVGFRAAVRHHASQLGLKGTVCNLPDGSVEIIAQGAEDQLQKFLKVLKEDGSPGHLESISTEFYPPNFRYEHFSIVYSRMS